MAKYLPHVDSTLCALSPFYSMPIINLVLTKTNYLYTYPVTKITAWIVIVEKHNVETGPNFSLTHKEADTLLNLGISPAFHAEKLLLLARSATIAHLPFPPDSSP